ncbi:Kunitz/Bovine pancreatic trypsin inhibitor domain protein [Oesophagostomum dentatum]|uniref:Kunitz/Bovine pancreatic trypsin inhibitor domain protein n=1 Tax=Oesophagostomum dentatum TaxID=61180 RepID=A0A0B1TI28_OESDE|nr:Kunitz/Bovine pancreatic trypsin inhibitor domain protein [Oesophagostomum dentatum]
MVSFLISDRCTLIVIQGLCTAYVQRFVYDPTLNACIPFNYGGCGTNDYYFISVEECRTACIFRRNSAIQSQWNPSPYKKR